jgi:hypothetical protein
MIRMNKAWITAVAFAAGLGVVGSADAQRLDQSGTPNYGTRSASPGFTPDPMTITVTSGGNLQVSSMGLGAGCTGYATEAPDFRFNLQGGSSSFLRFFVESAVDTTLVINGPNGQWHCNDDISSSNRNPMVDFTNAPPGQYDVWIGSYQANDRARGTLNITELSNRQPGGGNGGGGAVASAAQGSGALNIAGNPTFGDRSIAPGFTPDPLTASITSGGGINAANAGLPSGCVGWVAANPDFNVVLTGNSNFLRFFVNNTNEDTTLVINGPNGQWFCNDDSFNGRNPSVDFNGAGSGTYNVWVGSYTQGTNTRVQLNVTELQGQHP